jgi:hypothetical protein
MTDTVKLRRVHSIHGEELEERDRRIANLEEQVRSLEEALKKQATEYKIDLAHKDREYQDILSRVLGQNFILTADNERLLVQHAQMAEEKEEAESRSGALLTRNERLEAKNDDLTVANAGLQTALDAADYRLLNYEAEKDEDVVLTPEYKICPRCGSNQTQYTKQGWHCDTCGDTYNTYPNREF